MTFKLHFLKLCLNISWKQSRFDPCANRATARGAKKKIVKNRGAKKVRGAPKERQGRQNFDKMRAVTKSTN